MILILLNYKFIKQFISYFCYILKVVSHLKDNLLKFLLTFVQPKILKFCCFFEFELFFTTIRLYSLIQINSNFTITSNPFIATLINFLFFLFLSGYLQIQSSLIKSILILFINCFFALLINAKYLPVFLSPIFIYCFFYLVTMILLFFFIVYQVQFF